MFREGMPRTPSAEKAKNNPWKTLRNVLIGLTVAGGAAEGINQSSPKPETKIFQKAPPDRERAHPAQAHLAADEEKSRSGSSGDIARSVSSLMEAAAEMKLREDEMKIKEGKEASIEILGDYPEELKSMVEAFADSVRRRFRGKNIILQWDQTSQDRFLGTPVDLGIGFFPIFHLEKDGSISLSKKMGVKDANMSQKDFFDQVHQFEDRLRLIDSGQRKMMMDRYFAGDLTDEDVSSPVTK